MGNQPGVVIQTPVAQPLMTNTTPRPSSYPVQQPQAGMAPIYNPPQAPPQHAPLPGGVYPQGAPYGGYPPGSYSQAGGGYVAPVQSPHYPQPGTHYGAPPQGYAPPAAPPPYTQEPPLPSKM